MFYCILPHIESYVRKKGLNSDKMIKVYKDVAQASSSSLYDERKIIKIQFKGVNLEKYLVVSV